MCEREGERERGERGESFRHFVHSDSREHVCGCWLERSFGVVGVYGVFLYIYSTETDDDWKGVPLLLVCL